MKVKLIRKSKIQNTDMHDILYNVRLFERDDFSKKKFDKLTQLRNDLINPDSSTNPYLSTKYITGLWYFTELTWDGAPQLLIRKGKNLNLDVFDKLYIDSAIFDYICHDVAYDYEKEIAHGQDKMLCDQIVKGNIVTIYDSEHKDNN